MGLVVVFLSIGAWLLALFGALVCVSRGGFDWVSRSPGIPTLAVLGTVVGFGLLSGTTWLRLAGSVLAALAVLAFAGGSFLFLEASARDARRAEEGRLADEARPAERRPRTRSGRGREADRGAGCRAGGPRGRHPEPIQRAYVLNFVRRAGRPDPAWEPAERKAIVLLAADDRAEAKDLSLGRITHVKGLSQGALLAAQTFGPKHFEAEALDLRGAVSRCPDEDPRNDALGVIDLSLAGEPVPGQPGPAREGACGLAPRGTGRSPLRPGGVRPGQ